MNEQFNTLAEEHGLTGHLEEFAALLRPAVRLRTKPPAESECAPGASRFGGDPDLPAGFAWPVYEEVPMLFVAQLCLEDTAPHDRAGQLPATGLLSFFINAQFMTSDMVNEEERYDVCAVRFIQPGVELTRTPYPGDVAELEFLTPSESPCDLEFDKVEVLPAGESPFAHTLSEEAQEGYYDFMNEYIECAVIYGDPGMYLTSWLLGHCTYDDYIEATTLQDQHLLRVNSDFNAEFEWGDCDNLWFIMTAADLAARRFDRVRLYCILG